MKTFFPIWRAASLVSLLLLSACTGHRSFKQGDLLANDLQGFQPLSDRDHYVYVWQRLVDGTRAADGVHVEHVSALPEENEFEIAISEDGHISGRLRVRYTDNAMAILEEDDYSQGIRMVYSPPLMQLQAPLLEGEQRSSSIATVQQLEGTETGSVVEVSQTVRIRHTSGVESDLGNYKEGLSVRTNRTLQTAAGTVELNSAVLLINGVGEIRSEGSASAANIVGGGKGEITSIVTRRELACAIVGGKAVGDCRKIPERLAKLRER